MGKQSKNKKHCDTGSLENNEKEGVKVQLLNDEQLFCSTAKFTCRNCYISFLFKGESTWLTPSLSHFLKDMIWFWSYPPNPKN